MKKNVVFFFHLLLLLHHRSIDRVTKRQKRKKERKKERDFATQTNSSRITPPTQHPGKKSEKKNKRSVVRSFVRHGRWRHPNEEEHLVETETTRWRGRRVRTFFFFSFAAIFLSHSSLFFPSPMERTFARS